MEVIHNHIDFVNVHPLERMVSVIGGGALAVSGLRKGRSGIVQMITGAAMIERGVTGQCHIYRALGLRTASTAAHTSLPYELGVRARAAVTIDHPRDQIFEFWRELENLPRFMQHLVSVDRIDSLRSHWVAKGPMDRSVE